MSKLNLSLLIVVLSSLSCTLQGQYQISNIFRKFRNDQGVKHFNLSGDVTKMLQGKDNQLKSKVDEMHVYLFAKNQDISSADRAKIKKTLETEKFDLLVSTKEKNAIVTLHGKDNGGFITQLYAEMKVNGIPVYLMLSGKIMLNELSKMNFDFEGGNVLKNIPLP